MFSSPCCLCLAWSLVGLYLCVYDITVQAQSPAVKTILWIFVGDWCGQHVLFFWSLLTHNFSSLSLPVSLVVLFFCEIHVMLFVKLSFVFFLFFVVFVLFVVFFFARLSMSAVLAVGHHPMTDSDSSFPPSLGHNPWQMWIKQPQLPLHQNGCRQ